MKKVFRFLRKEVKEIFALLHAVPSLLLAVFVLSLVLMNLLANKSLALNLDWLALDAGIMVSWMAFLTLDIAVKSFGPKAATRLTIAAVAINLGVSAIFLVVAKVPGVWGESFVDGGAAINTALDNTIGGTWYVLAGSTIAFIVSATVNNILNWSIGKSIKKHPNSFKAFMLRSYVSTTIAQFVDNLVFSLLVSLSFFGWSLLQCFMCALTGAIVELIFEILFSPIGYKISERWRAQGIGEELSEVPEDITLLKG